VVRINLSPRFESLRVPETEFIAFLKLCFGQKRKTLWNNLKARYHEGVLKAALAESGIKPTIRAEALTLERMASLFRALSERNK
jgi:16S rRNA (adenine1518-N6/adenine1519-N6)-dimethyltransferase